MVERAEPYVDRVAAAPKGTDSAWPVWAAQTWGWALSEALLFPVVALFTLGLIGALPDELLSDSWLVILGGKEIVQHGLPTHDALTIWGHGRDWVDQQWLGQLVFYGLYALGGVKLFLFGHSLAVAFAFVAAIAAARWRGGSVRSVCWIALPAVYILSWASWNARAQTLALPLFVAVVWLLIRDGRSESRRIFLVFPLLMVWGNVHGSAVAGASLVGLYGVVYGIERRRLPLRSWLPRTALLCIGPVACLFVSPYAPDLPGYYADILANPGFREFITEWKPTSPSIQTSPFYLLAFGAVWILGRRGDLLTRFEKLLLLLTLLTAVQTIRNVIWFALVALILIPTPLDAALKPNTAATRYSFLNRALVLISVAAVIAAVAGVAAKPSSWFTSSYPKGALTAIDRAAAQQPGVQVFANEQYGDWLLLNRRELRGRLVFDIRFELLSETQFQTLVNARRRVEGWRATLAPFGLFVLKKGPDSRLAAALLREPGARLRYRGSGTIVISRPVRALGQ
jgi:hypothetical protein